MTTTGTAARRGRPSIRWPRATAACGKVRGYKLTQDMIRHVKECPQCEAFYFRRFDRRRWWAAWGRKNRFTGDPCPQCGNRERRVVDGACRACQGIVGREFESELAPGKRGDGSSRPGRAEWLRKAHEKADKGTPFATATATGPGMGGRLWRVDGTQYGDGQKHITIRPADGGRGGLDDEHFERHDRYRTPHYMDIFGTALEEVLNTLDRRAQEYRHEMNEQPSA
jgi:hypothetical protein